MRLKFLLTPGWIAMILVGLVFSSLCFSVLAPWQFRRNAERTTENNAIQASFTAPAVPLPQLLGPQQAPTAQNEFRTVILTGSYLPRAEMIARLRSVLTEPAYEVLTPFRTTDGAVALIDRGFVRPTDGTKPPTYAAAPTGQVTVTARIRQDEIDPKHRDAMFLDGRMQVYTVDSQTVAHADTLAIRPGYFELTANQPGVLNPLPLPDLDPGPFFAYAVQWLIFGAFAPVGIGYLIWRELHPESEDEIELGEFDDLAEFDEDDDSADSVLGAAARALHTDDTPGSAGAVRPATESAPPTEPHAPADESPAGGAQSGAKPGAPAQDAGENGRADGGHGVDAANGESGSAAPRAAPGLIPADRYGRRR